MATIYAKNKLTGEWERVGPAAVATDVTLTLSGSPADAKVTGDAIKELQNNKQDKLTGTESQYVGFDTDGNAVAKNMLSGDDAMELLAEMDIATPVSDGTSILTDNDGKVFVI